MHHVIRASVIPMIRHQRTPQTGRAPRRRIGAAPRPACLPSRPTFASRLLKGWDPESDLRRLRLGVPAESKPKLCEARLLNWTFVHLRLRNDVCRTRSWYSFCPTYVLCLLYEAIINNESPRAQVRCCNALNKSRTDSVLREAMKIRTTTRRRARRPGR